jgi:NADP-dependent 3-hydroxy acid dehydrogenase YdfG
VKIGSQLVKAGSQFTATLTGTTRIAKQNVVKDNVVFVAGATGRLGARIVRECLLAGYTVRAGVRSLEKGQDLIETAKELGVLSPEQLKRLSLQQYDLFDRDTIAPAIGNAGTNRPHAWR